jgi:hypothetical protein
MLAGKFKDAEELEKAYIELQRKLGSKDEPEGTEEVRGGRFAVRLPPAIILIVPPNGSNIKKTNLVYSGLGAVSYLPGRCILLYIFVFGNATC